ncbi:MAG: ATP-binding protein [Deltaproteobacteria bacterium]|nr:MAG: ATP-binding protein [Deltaproteobacteria bacterium]
MDPRLTIIERRLKDIKRIIAVSGGKGGVGKSLTASVMALIFSRLGYKTGLFDLDFGGPSIHTVLGLKGALPREEKGIIPPDAHGIKFMSIIHYAGDNPSPIRGIDISNAMIELLAITRWGRLDFLILDMPPGIGDSTLDVIRLLKRAEFLIITTESRVTLDVVKKLLNLLKELKAPIIGVIENMKLTRSSFLSKEIGALDVPFLGEIDFDRGLEDAIGNVDHILKTRFAESMKEIIVSKEIFKLKDR